jgi:hypothetical protein
MMTDSDELYTGMDVDDDLTSAMGTETLADRDLVPPGFENTPRARTEGSQIETFQHRRYLKVERSASLRKDAKISKIWNHGTEYRALDTTHLDKHWKCQHCKNDKLMKITDGTNTNTSYVIRHLKNIHKIDIKREELEEDHTVPATIPADYRLPY